MKVAQTLSKTHVHVVRLYSYACKIAPDSYDHIHHSECRLRQLELIIKNILVVMYLLEVDLNQFLVSVVTETTLVSLHRN